MRSPRLDTGNVVPESVEYRHFPGPRHIDAALAELASRQHGVVTVAQMRGLGLDMSAVARRVARGTLHRRHRGVYAVGHHGLSRDGELLAAALACGARAWVTGWAAVELHELGRWRGGSIDIVVRRNRQAPTGVRIQKTRRLVARDVTTVRGIPVVSVERLLVDLTRETDAYELAHLIHEAAFQGKFFEPAVHDAMRRVAGRHKLAVLDQALWLHASGSAGTRSGLERTFRRLVGPPEPLVNTSVCGFEVDFHWPDHGLVVEVDGPGHSRPSTRADDADRDRVLRAAGLIVLRFTDDDLKYRPRDVHQTVRAALQRDLTSGRPTRAGHAATGRPGSGLGAPA